MVGRARILIQKDIVASDLGGGVNSSEPHAVTFIMSGQAHKKGLLILVFERTLELACCMYMYSCVCI